VILYEALAAFALFAVLLALCLQTAASTIKARRSADRRAQALLTAANVVEQLKALSYSELTDEGLAAARLEDTIARSLPEAKLQVAVVPLAGEPAGKRLDVEIRWPAIHGTSEAPVRASSFVFAPAGDAHP